MYQKEVSEKVNFEKRQQMTKQVMKNHSAKSQLAKNLFAFSLERTSIINLTILTSKMTFLCLLAQTRQELVVSH